MEKKEVTVKLGDGDCKVYVLGDWAAHRPINNTRKVWCVTHVPCGRRALYCGSLSLAKCALAALQKVDSVRIVAGDTKELSDVLRRNGFVPGAINEFQGRVTA